MTVKKALTEYCPNCFGTVCSHCTCLGPSEESVVVEITEDDIVEEIYEDAMIEEEHYGAYI